MVNILKKLKYIIHKFYDKTIFKIVMLKLLFFFLLFGFVSCKTVHLIPHSHCDVGWLETVDSYYKYNVSTILDGVYKSLMNDTTGNRRFNWAEISYFSYWYDELSNEDKNNMKNLIKDGKFEFVGGGWVQHDESITTVENMIHQMSLGHQYLKDNFNVEVKIGWQIDPFGSSITTPSLFAKLGFDAVVLNRIPQSIFDKMYGQGKMGFVWHGSTSLGYNETSLFTIVLSNWYCSPSPLAFEPMVHGVPNYYHAEYITDRNIDYISFMLMENLMLRFSSYKTDNLLVPLGCDFQFQQSEIMFSNTEKLIDYINKNSKFGAKIKFSTLTEYFNSVYQENIEWDIYREDFVPYWQGFYTSRPALKASYNQASSYLRAANLLKSLQLQNNTELTLASTNNGILMHHDAITGTSCSGSPECIPYGQYSGDHKVVQDYYKKINDSIIVSHSSIQKSLSQIMEMKNTSQKGIYYATIFNQNPWPINQTIELEIPKQLSKMYNYIYILDGHNSNIICQVNQAHKIYFFANMSGFSIKKYTIIFSNQNDEKKCHQTTMKKYNGIDESGLLYLTCNDTFLRVNQSFRGYESLNDDAYSLRVGGYTEYEILEMRIEKGILFSDIHFVYPYHNQTVRFYDNLSCRYDIFHHFGIIPKNTEISMVFNTTLKSDSLYHYINSFQTVERKISDYPSINQDSYPATDIMYIEDKDSRLTFVSGKPQSVYTGSEGYMETLLHRRTLGRDIDGNICLDDQQRFKTENILLIGKNHLTKKIAKELRFTPIVTITNMESKLSQYDPIQSWDDMLDIISFESLNQTHYIIKIQNMNEQFEDNKPIKFNLNQIFNDLNVMNIQEVTLTSTTPLKDIIRKNWKTARSYEEENRSDQMIMPQDIRAFVIELRKIGKTQSMSRIHF